MSGFEPRISEVGSYQLRHNHCPEHDNFATLVVSIPIGCLMGKQMAYVHKHLINLRFYIRL